jgi:hypothetical protein
MMAALSVIVAMSPVEVVRNRVALDFGLSRVRVGILSKSYFLTPGKLNIQITLTGAAGVSVWISKAGRLLSDVIDSLTPQTIHVFAIPVALRDDDLEVDINCEVVNV